VELAAQSQLSEAQGPRKLLQAAEFDKDSRTLVQLIAEAAVARDDSNPDSENDGSNEQLMQQSRRKLWGLRGGDKRTQDVSTALEKHLTVHVAACTYFVRFSNMGGN
jgi:hypothetical protein